jgi:hypothetical protein
MSEFDDEAPMKNRKCHTYGTTQEKDRNRNKKKQEPLK